MVAPGFCNSPLTVWAKVSIFVSAVGAPQTGRRETPRGETGKSNCRGWLATSVSQGLDRTTKPRTRCPPARQTTVLSKSAPITSAVKSSRGADTPVTFQSRSWCSGWNDSSVSTRQVVRRSEILIRLRKGARLSSSSPSPGHHLVRPWTTDLAPQNHGSLP